MGIFSKPDAETVANREASRIRQQDILESIPKNTVPSFIGKRLREVREGAQPWTSTLTAAELLIARSHGVRPIAAISATCWLQYGRSWTEGHMEGWDNALKRLRAEAKALGANAVVDVKMRTVNIELGESMDFTLIGTAVKVDGLPASTDPIIATVPALEFVRMLESNVVPTGIAIGACFEWLSDWRGNANRTWYGNIESTQLSDLWKYVRNNAHWALRDNAKGKGNGVLAHINFSQMFEVEQENQPTRYLARHIVIATMVDAARALSPLPGQSQPSLMDPLLKFQTVVDMCAGKTPLSGRARHHESYATNESEGAI